MSAPSVAHRVEYGLFLAVAAVAARLPERLALSLGSFLGWLAGRVLRIRRGVVLENLTRAFPGESVAWRERTATATYRHFGREAVALLRMASYSRQDVLGRVDIEGIDRLAGPVSEGRGAIVLAGHLGNWEMAGAALAANGLPIDVVAKRQANPLFTQAVERMRGKLGMRVIYHTDAARPFLRSLKDGRVAALVADQNVPRGGAFVDFFGTPAATARGPAVLAARSGADLVMLTIRRLEGPTWRYAMRLSRVPFTPTGDAEADAQGLLRAYHERLEQAIREAPDQYFWLHKRWKARPEEPPTGVPVSAPTPHERAGEVG